MSACHTCAKKNAEMPERIVVLVQGAPAFTKAVRPEHRLEDLLSAAQHILVLAEKERAKANANG